MRQLIPVIFSLVFIFSYYIYSQSDSTFSLAQINEYEKQTRQLISYLEGTLNFIGDPEELPSEKDIVFNQSYLKLFVNDEVQVEDDLDENRDKPLNKDIQAYLKDIDFFFKEADFKLVIDTTDRIITADNKIVFKVTVNRFLKGITVNNDTIENNQLRFVEINLDPFKKDLKIASIYTTKLNENEELRYWWNDMSAEWKNYFGKSVIVYDTIPLNNVIWFSDSSLVTLKHVEEYIFDSSYIQNEQVHDTTVIAYDTIVRLVPDTIEIRPSTIYKILQTFRKTESVDISNTLIIEDLKPVSELTALKQLNISNTLIDNLKPIRNHKNLVVLNCSGSAVTDLSPLRYLNSLADLNLSYTAVNNIQVLSSLSNLKELNLMGSAIVDLSGIGSLNMLNHLNISCTGVSDLKALEGLSQLSDLNISSTKITSLSAIESLGSIQNLNIDSVSISNLEPLKNYNNLIVLQANNTGIESLIPLNNKPELKIIYCNNSNVSYEEANRYMDNNPGCLVIYNSVELENWWNNLSSQWRLILQQSYNVENPVTVEKLQEIILKKELSLAFREQLRDISPLSMMHRLEKLDISNTSVSDISYLSSLSNLENLNISNTKIAHIEPLVSLRNIKVINIENTGVSDITPLEASAPDIIYCDNSRVNMGDALNFKNSHPETIVLYQSDELRLWWKAISRNWKKFFSEYMGIPDIPSNTELQNLVDITILVIDNNKEIEDLYPLVKFQRIKELLINSTLISDFAPVFELTTLEKLDISKNPISDLTGIRSLRSLKDLIIKNTPVEDLEPITAVNTLTSLDISGTKITSLKYISGLNNLEALFISNTRIKNIKPLLELPKLRYLQCFNTSIKSSKIEQYRKQNPNAEIIYY